MNTSSKNNQQYWDRVRKDSTCPVCGKRRGAGNYAKCSKITQLKHQQERTVPDK